MNREVDIEVLGDGLRSTSSHGAVIDAEVVITVVLDGVGTEASATKTVGVGFGRIVESYDELDNRPLIGGKTVSGDRTAGYYGLASINDITWIEI